MSKIIVIFTRRRHLGSVAIRTWMRSRFSHCAVLDPMTNTVIEAVYGGVRERPLLDLIQEASCWESVEISMRNPTQFLAVLRGQIGKPYDWKGVLGFWFRRNWRDDKAFFCSELIAWGLEVCGQPAFRREAYRISPEQLYLPVFDRR